MVCALRFVIVVLVSVCVIRSYFLCGQDLEWETTGVHWLREIGQFLARCIVDVLVVGLLNLIIHGLSSVPTRAHGRARDTLAC